MIRILTYLLVAFVMSGCSHSTHTGTDFIPKAPDYQDSVLWYTQEKGEEVDVFYVTPTCIFDWVEEESGLPCHFYDVYGEKMKENFDYSLKLADEIFGKRCNFYAPYYRQISLDSWLQDEKTIQSRFSLAMKDVEQSFQYYLKHENEGRPFVLAGYSQGAKAVVELVKLLDPETLSRLKAAYAIGYRLAAEDLSHPNIHPAQGETDQGVVISYNSVKEVKDIWQAVGAHSKACINPVNWTIDTTAAVLNDSITVKIDPEYQVLLVSGYDGGGMNIPLLDGTVTPGNYHLSELTLYQECLQKNILQRIK